MFRRRGGLICLSNATPNHAAGKGRTNCAADTEASTDSRSQAPFYIFLLVSPSSFHLSYYLEQFIDAKPNLSGYFACENEEKNVQTEYSEVMDHSPRDGYLEPD